LRQPKYTEKDYAKVFKVLSGKAIFVHSCLIYFGRGFRTGLPDGLFSYQKTQFGYILEGLGMETVGIFYEHLEYFSAIWYIFLQFGIACGRLVYFSRFGMFGPRKIWQPWFRRLIR
jgi:hypothetical protein